MHETLLIVPYGNTFVTLNLIDTDERGISSFRRIFTHTDHYTDLRHKLNCKRTGKGIAHSKHLQKYMPPGSNNILVYKLKLSSKHKWSLKGIVKGDTESLISQVWTGSQRIFYGRLANKTFKKYLP